MAAGFQDVSGCLLGVTREWSYRLLPFVSMPTSRRWAWTLPACRALARHEGRSGQAENIVGRPPSVRKVSGNFCQHLTQLGSKEPGNARQHRYFK